MCVRIYIHVCYENKIYKKKKRGFSSIIFLKYHSTIRHWTSYYSRAKSSLADPDLIWEVRQHIFPLHPFHGAVKMIAR